MDKRKSVKAVFFDAGGTLFRPFPSVGEIYARTASPYGCYDARKLEAEFETAWNKRGGLSSLGSETSEAKERAWWQSLVEEVFESQGGVKQFDEFFEKLHRSFEDKHLWEIFPEVLEVLHGLRARGLILGVVSNWDLRLPRLFRNLGLDAYFDFLLTSSMCGVTKPSQGIFREALRQASCQPEEVLHVGDTYEEDFVGARRAGIRALLLDRNRSGNSAPPEFRISSLRELKI